MDRKTWLPLAAAFLLGFVANHIATFVVAMPGQGNVKGCVNSSNVCVGMTYKELANARPSESLGGMVEVICGTRPSEPGAWRDVSEALLVSCKPGPSSIIFSDGHVRTAIFLNEGRIARIHRSWANPLEL